MPGPVDHTDTNVRLRTGAVDLTADETIAFTIKGGVHKQAPMGVVVLVPTMSAGETLGVVVRSVTTNKKFSCRIDDLLDDADTYPRSVRLNLPYTDAESWELFLDVTSNGAPNLGAVQAWVESPDYCKGGTS